jgi:AmiR/NasT family two-component response regulator
MTAYSDDKTLERAKITEPFGYLIKPFKDREVNITIEIALYRHEMEKKLKESYEKLRESKKWLDGWVTAYMTIIQ